MTELANEHNLTSGKQYKNWWETPVYTA